MTTKHTPGPWAVKEYDNGFTGEHGLHGIFQATHLSDGQQTPIVEKVWGSTLDESDANARLIAAAPALAEALRALVDVEEHHRNGSPNQFYRLIGGIGGRARALLATIDGKAA
jgi:hypothetical protein